MSAIATTGKATLALNKGLATVKRYSPQILTTVGILGTITSGVLAARATLHLEPIIEKHEQSVDKAKKKTHELTADEYSSTQHKREITKIYLTTSKDIFKLYALPVSIGVASIGCLIGSHNIMSQRNVATVAAYKALETSFNQYRQRVVEDLGEDKDREYRYATKTTEVEVLDDEGNVSTEEKTVSVPSDYQRIFDIDNDNWSPINGMNEMHIRAAQRWMNEKLNAQGYLFLNDVYKALGFEDSTEGCVVGWLRSSNPKAKDGIVDFGVFDLQTGAALVDFEEPVLLDFNVDGIVFEHIHL